MHCRQVCVVAGPDETGIVLELDSPDYALAPAQAGWQRLTVPGLPLMQEAGWPELPVKRVWLQDVPMLRSNCAFWTMSDASQGLFRLSPAPRPAPIAEEFEPGRWEVAPDPDVYASDESRIPASGAFDRRRLAARSTCVQVELAHFNIARPRGQLIWHRQMRVEVRLVRRHRGCTGTTLS